MKKRLLVALLFTVSVSAFAQLKDSTVAWHYSTSNYDCAIFPMSNNDMQYPGKRFTPGFPDIDQAEYALTQQLLEQQDSTKRIADIYRHLKKYKRQYFGYIGKDGHKVLYINLFWDENMYIKGWLKQMIMVSGGDSNYWNIKCDLTSNKLYDLHINSDE